MKVKRIPIIIGVFGTIPKRLVKELGDFEIRGQVETIQTTSWKPEETCSHSKMII